MTIADLRFEIESRLPVWVCFLPIVGAAIMWACQRRVSSECEKCASGEPCGR